MVYVIAVTRTVPSTVSKEQVWAGLKIKARDPIGFVKPITECTVLSEDSTSLLRRIVIGGNNIHEEVTFVEPYWAHFKMRESGTEVMNIISVDENGQTLLTFAFRWIFPGVEEGSEAERTKGEEMKNTAGSAVEASIAKIEELVKNGQL